MAISVQEIEAAINRWRARRPARGNEYALSPEVNALATIYALMIYKREQSIDPATLDESVRRLLVSD